MRLRKASMAASSSAFSWMTSSPSGLLVRRSSWMSMGRQRRPAHAALVLDAQGHDFAVSLRRRLAARGDGPVNLLRGGVRVGDGDVAVGQEDQVAGAVGQGLPVPGNVVELPRGKEEAGGEVAAASAVHGGLAVPALAPDGVDAGVAFHDDDLDALGHGLDFLPEGREELVAHAAAGVHEDEDLAGAAGLAAGEVDAVAAVATQPRGAPVAPHGGLADAAQLAPPVEGPVQ